MVKYFPIRTKSDHSILYGFGTIDEYINKAKELNLKHLGLADRFTASSLYDFVNKCNANNITPISGVEFNLKENGRLSLITLYAKNKVGMKNLFHLVKKSFTNKENYFDKSSFLTMEQILQNKDGIIVLTGYNGTLVYEAIKKNDNNIFYHLDSLKNIFDDDLYLTIERKSDYAFEIGKKMEINVIPSHEVLFVEKEHKKACDIFWALRTGFKLNETDNKHGGKRPVCSDNNVFIGNKEDSSLFLNDIRSESLYENLEKFASKFEVSFEFDTHLKPKALLKDGESEIDELKKLIQKGFKEKRAGTKYAKESKEKIKEELDTIWGNDYLDYFLVVQDYCEYARNHAGGLGAGRGCFLPDNEVTIRGGNKKKIQDVKIGDNVLTHDTKTHPVEKLFKYNIEEECIKIVLSNGKTITCTTDHKIFKKDEGFVPANKLKVGDVLLGAKRNSEFAGTLPCVECGKERSFNVKEARELFKHSFYKSEGEYICNECRNKNNAKHPNIISTLKNNASKQKENKEYCKRMSESLKKHWKENKDERTKIWRDWVNSEKSLEWRNKLSEINKKRYEKDEEMEKLLSQQKKYKKGIFKSKRMNEKIRFDSSYEEKALNILETSSDIKNFHRCKLRIKYWDTEGKKERTYLPDFTIETNTGDKIILEIKAKWQTKEQNFKDKKRAAEKFVKNNDTFSSYIVWTEDELSIGNDLLHNELSIIDITYFDYKGYVYDIKVKDVHNYTISDVTVHNSAAGSEIGYLIGIHDTDPIRHKLLFERFLSPGRGSEYTITYEDGTEEKSIVSEKHKINGSTLYTHQLEVGDVINGKRIKTVEMTRPTASSVDVDTDFHTVGRKKVIDYVKRKYGEEKISNVMTFNTFKTLKSIKSIGQVTTIPFFKLNQIGKIIDASRSLKDIFEEKGEDYNKFLDWTDSFGEEGELIFNYAPMLEGRIREQGVHACAILISPVPLDDVIPVQTSEKDGTLLSQWEYPACEGIGLLKMDFLGLDTVDLIDNTIKMIEKNKGIKVDKQKIIDSALDDKDVFDLFQKGYTDAIFQFSSDGVKKFLRELKPDSFEDLYAVTALYRPGPMGMGAHNSYAKRKAGIEESIPFDNKKLIDTDVAKVLKDTYELIPYQESLMTLARVCADFTPYETDLLRKATAKKKEKLLKSLKPKFLSGLKNHINDPKKKEIMKTVMKEMPNASQEAKKKRALILAKDSLLTDSDLEEIWKNLEEFGSYSFNKSHSVSYTLNAYISAYLKVHYPAEFMATTIRQNAKDKEKFKAFSQEAKRLGIKLYVPDVNYSESKTVAKGNSIVYGFDMASFIGPDVAKCIAIERKQNGKFKDMADFSLRIAKHGHFSKRLIESLGSLGAFKSLGETRKGVIENFDSIKSYVDSQNNNIDNMGLFGNITTFSLPKEEYSFLKICQLEYDNCGTFITYTPLDKIAPGSIDNIAFRASEDDFKNKRYNFQNFKTFSPNKKGRFDNTFKVYDFLVYVSDISSKKYGSKTTFNITIDTGETEKVITPGPLNGYTDKPLTSTGKEIKKGKVYKMTISYSNWNNFERFNAIDISEVILNKNGTFHSIKKVPIEKR